VIRVNPEAVIRWIQKQRLVLSGNVVINFRDREREITELSSDLSIGGVRVIYGPLGAGKTTMLNLLAKSLEVIGAGDTAIIYVNYEDRAANVLMPGGSSGGSINDLINKISITVMGTTISIGQVIGLAKELWRYVREFHGVDNVLIIHDDLDRWFISGGIGREAVQELIAMYAGEFEGRLLGTAPWGDKYVKVIVSVSDQTAVELAWKYRGKGGLLPMLLWNLPREAFLEVVNEVKDRVRPEVQVEPEVLWQLFGGNIRALMELILNYDWDVINWLGNVIGHIRNIAYREALLLNLPNTSALIMRIKSRIGDPRPDDVVYNALLPGEPLIEDNVLIRIVGKPLSQLPREEWVGEDYAYQLPAYYWVLKAMIIKGGIDVAAQEVLKELSK